MSPSTRVVTGVDDRGRPRSEWRVDADGGAAPAYGFMEPAYSTTIDRRKATPEELAAARAREDEPSHLVTPTVASPGVIVQHPPRADRELASRHRGGEVTRQLIAATQAPRTAASYRPKPVMTPEEEPPVSIETDDHTIELSGLDRLALAAAEASRTHQDKEAADTAWDVAREALVRAYAEVEGIVEPLPPQPDDDHAHYVLTVPLVDEARASVALDGETRVVPEPIGGGPVRSRSGEGQRPAQAAARDRRAAMVMAAMGRLGDDMGAVAAELGMKKNAVAQVVKFARKRAGVEA